jgi:hypothetical protein
LGVWQFWLKEIVWPAQAPINLTTQVGVSRAGFNVAASGENKERFEGIELTITATNPSSRVVYLLPNYWLASALTTETRQKSEDWVKDATDRMASKQMSIAGLFYKNE